MTPMKTEILKKRYILTYESGKGGKVFVAQVNYKRMSKEELIKQTVKIVNKLFKKEKVSVAIKHLKKPENYRIVYKNSIGKELSKDITAFKKIKDAHSIEIIDHDQIDHPFFRWLEETFRISPIHKNALRVFPSQEPSIEVDRNNATQEFVKNFVKYFS